MELKKLVYLYLMNYAKIQPRTTLLVVNAFVMDCDHPNPLVRALAIRTMGCIRKGLHSVKAPSVNMLAP